MEGPRTKKIKTEDTIHEPVVDLIESENFRTQFLQMEVEQLLNTAMAPKEELKKAAKFSKKIRQILDKLSDGPLDSSKKSVVFRKPNKIVLIGSFHFSSILPDFNLDLLIIIPKNFFELEDLKDFGYFEKRRLYLLRIAQALQKEEEISKLQVDFFRHDPLKPFLVVQPNQGTFILKIHLGLEMETFPLTQLMPNVKHFDFSLAGASVLYNSSILEDMFIGSHWKTQKMSLGARESLERGLILTKIWLRQQGWSQRPDGLNGFLAGCIMQHMINSGQLGEQVTEPLAVFKLFLLFLTKWPSNGIWMGNEEHTSAELRTLLSQHFSVILMDPSGVLNLASRMTPQSLLTLQRDAQSALLKLNSPLCVNVFDQLFLNKSDMRSRFDLIMRVDQLPSLSNSFDFVAFSFSLLRLIQVGLTERILSLSFLYPSSNTFDLNILKDNLRSKQIPSTIMIGLHINPLKSKSIIDLGPSYDTHSDQNEFLNLWKELAEVRRFKDGRILYAVVWEDTDPDHVIPVMVEYLLREHLACKTEFLGNQLEPLYLTPKDRSLDPTPAILSTWVSLEKKLKSVHSLPLGIAAVVPISSIFRKIGPILSHTSAHLEGTIEFEFSSKWPNNPVAIQKLKAALLLFLQKALKSQLDIDSSSTPEFLQIHYSSLIFRFYIILPKEFEHLYSEKEALLAKQSTHSNYIIAFSLQNSIYTSTTELAIRWLSGHLFSGHFEQQTIELLVASLFSQPFEPPPLNALAGFYRFLKLLAYFDFQDHPVLVDWGQRLSEEEILQIEEQFNSIRKKEPDHFLIFVASAYNIQGNFWNHHRPSRIVLKRAQKLAAVAVQRMAELMDSFCQESELWEQLFVPSFDDFDIVLELTDRKEWIQLNALSHLVEDLQDLFGSRALLFHDAITGQHIAISFHPSFFKPSTQLPSGGLQSIENSQFHLNQPELYHSLKLLGQGLLQNILVKE